MRPEAGISGHPAGLRCSSLGGTPATDAARYCHPDSRLTPVRLDAVEPIIVQDPRMPSADCWAWWRTVSAEAPGGLCGLWFGLGELSDGGWHIYVVGTAGFDPEDEAAEWAVGPYAWSADDRYFPFPGAGDDDLAAALRSAADLVSTLHPWTTIEVDGVATGFDGGDFVIVYQR